MHSSQRLKPLHHSSDDGDNRLPYGKASEIEMGFITTEMSYKERSVVVYHDYFPHCKDQPWIVSTVSCLPHDLVTKAHGLTSALWQFSNYNPTENGFSATLTLSPLDLRLAKDKHLFDQFQKNGQLSILVNFHSPNQDYLRLNLKP